MVGIAKYTKQDVVFLKELIEAGRYRAVIDPELSTRSRSSRRLGTSRRSRRRETSS